MQYAIFFCQQVIQVIYMPELRVSSMFRISAKDRSNVLIA